MPTTLNHHALVQLFQGDLEWLLKQTRTLERDHIEQLIQHCIATKVDWDGEKLVAKDVEIERLKQFIANYRYVESENHAGEYHCVGCGNEPDDPCTETCPYYQEAAKAE